MIVVFLIATVITWALGGWWPDRTVEPALGLAAAVAILCALSLAGSVLPRLDRQRDRGLHGLRRRARRRACSARSARRSAPTRSRTSPTTSSWILPFEALYQAALGALTADTVGFTRLAIDLGPFGGAEDFGPLLWPWAIAYLAIVGALALSAFARRDL